MREANAPDGEGGCSGGGLFHVYDLERLPAAPAHAPARGTRGAARAARHGSQAGPRSSAAAAAAVGGSGGAGAAAAAPAGPAFRSAAVQEQEQAADGVSQEEQLIKQRYGAMVRSGARGCQHMLC